MMMRGHFPVDKGFCYTSIKQQNSVIQKEINVGASSETSERYKVTQSRLNI